MTLRGTRTTGAFGLFNRPVRETGESLRKAFLKAKECAFQQSRPTTRVFPLSALRRQFSNILALDVIFSPRLIPVTKSSNYANSRFPMYKTWEVSPVWRTAPTGASYKADKLCSLLHTIATDGWKANITHLLVRLAINVWHLSKRDFDGLCHLIFKKIKIGSCEDPVSRKSPDPLQRFSALSNNPIANYYRVSRYESRKSRAQARRCGLHRWPYNLWLRADLLRAQWRKAFARQIGLRQPT